MLRLKRRQREVIVEKLPDLANVIAGACIFGQFVTGQRFSLPVALAGVALWTILSVYTLWVAGEDQ